MTSIYFESIVNRVVYNDTYKTITFRADIFSWQHEELLTFTQSFFQLIKSASLIEIIEGADRTNVRFSYHREEFVLNIESICESIWIEHYGYHEEALLITLYQEIKLLLQRNCNG